MLTLVHAGNRADECVRLRAMFEARKAVFVDLLGWNLPVLAGRYEVDEFDDRHAVYLILTDPDGHRASARLLPTHRGSLLSARFDALCDGPVPAGPEIFEITRFCLDRRLRAVDRRVARNELVTAIALVGRSLSIATFTGVAEAAWLEQIQTFGWQCAPLGPARRCAGAMLGALRIEIDRSTIAKLKRAGVFALPELAPELEHLTIHAGAQHREAA